MKKFLVNAELSIKVEILEGASANKLAQLDGLKGVIGKTMILELIRGTRQEAKGFSILEEEEAPSMPVVEVPGVLAEVPKETQEGATQKAPELAQLAQARHDVIVSPKLNAQQITEVAARVAAAKYNESLSKEAPSVDISGPVGKNAGNSIFARSQLHGSVRKRARSPMIIHCFLTAYGEQYWRYTKNDFLLFLTCIAEGLEHHPNGVEYGEIAQRLGWDRNLVSIYASRAKTQGYIYTTKERNPLEEKNTLPYLNLN